MLNPHHQEILSVIKKNSGAPKANPFLNAYLGNEHVRYPINNPKLRSIARTWMQDHKHLTVEEFKAVLTSLIEAESCTEKMTAGILMGYCTKEQRNFDPEIFDEWLDHLVGWVEVDTLCTGDFVRAQLPAQWPKWKKLILKLSKDPNINKRRASLVLFCSVLGHVTDDDLAEVAFRNINRLKSEKHVLITKAISWVLRTMIKNYRPDVTACLLKNADTLPKIAIREATAKLKTGKKTK